MHTPKPHKDAFYYDSHILVKVIYVAQAFILPDQNSV
jgi:hypothetical protein